MAAALILAVAGVHLAAALGHSFASQADEAYLLLLARSVLGGAYAIPGPLGAPVTELPGWPVLLAPFAAAFGDRWEAYRWLGLAATLAASSCAWRLAKRHLPAREAAAAALAVALNPTLAGLSGTILPDAAFSALAFAALAAYPGRGSTLLAGAAAFMRPHGALLALALSAAEWKRKGPREAAAFAVISFAPPALWLMRNLLSTGHATAYAANWGAQGSFAPVAQAHALLATVLGRGALGLASVPAPLQALAGAGLLGLAALGFRAKRREPLVLALGVFTALVLALHLTWSFAVPRYALPLLAPFAVLAALGLRTLGQGARRGALAALALCAAVALRADWAIGSRASWPPPGPVLPRLSAWARASTPPDARFEGVACQPLRLLAARETACSFAVRPREAWLDGLLERGVSYVHEPAGFRPDGFFPDAMAAFTLERGRWLAKSGYFERVFADPADGAVYRVKLADPARLRAAAAKFREAPAYAASQPEKARALLREAVALEPRFANAWALLALLEKDPARSLALMRRAAAADPESPEIASELARLEG